MCQGLNIIFESDDHFENLIYKIKKHSGKLKRETIHNHKICLLKSDGRFQAQIKCEQVFEFIACLMNKVI